MTQSSLPPPPPSFRQSRKRKLILLATLLTIIVIPFYIVVTPRIAPPIINADPDIDGPPNEQEKQIGTNPLIARNDDDRLKMELKSTLTRLVLWSRTPMEMVSVREKKKAGLMRE